MRAVLPRENETSSQNQTRLAVAKMTTVENSDRTLTTGDASMSAVVTSGSPSTCSGSE
jgi:hypothetical protein